MDTNTAGELARRIWATRPPRLSGSPGAGVCEGIGVRYRIDPMLVRVLFVAGAFVWVTSVPIYLILWGLMPRYGVPYSPFESLGRPGSDRQDRTAGVLLLIFAVLTSGLLGSSLVDGAALAFLGSLALAGGAIVLLHKRTPVPPPGLVAAPIADAARSPVGGDAPVEGGSGDTAGAGQDGAEPSARVPPPRVRTVRPVRAARVTQAARVPRPGPTCRVTRSPRAGRTRVRARRARPRPATGTRWARRPTTGTTGTAPATARRPPTPRGPATPATARAGRTTHRGTPTPGSGPAPAGRPTTRARTSPGGRGRSGATGR